VTAGPEVAPAPLLAGADEVFRGIYTRAGLGIANEVLTVTSALAGEGRTTLSLGLAVTLAQDFPERRVVVVETAFEQPVLANDFAVDPWPGLLECVVGEQPLTAACRPTSLDNLDILPAGGPASSRGRPLRSEGMALLIDVLRRSYDLVVLDAPGVLVNSDAILLSDLADATILVVRAGATPSALLSRTLDLLDQTRLRGVVLNGVGPAAPGWVRRLFGA
jgi:Mrp family chromosome partitioning ATPase